MSWRLKKQILYLTFFFAFLFLITFYFYNSLQKPSCFDGKKNQGEEGVDCGGPCPVSCEVKDLLPPKTETFPEIIYDQSIDLLGLVKNPNQNWALKDVLAIFYVYDKFDRLQNKVTAGKVSILPREARYIAVLNLDRPKYQIGKIELKLVYDRTNWKKLEFESLPLSLVNQRIENRLFLTEISNPTERFFENLELIVRFFDQEHKLVGVSKSLIEKVPAFETVSVSLTLPQVENISDFEVSLHAISL